MGTPLHKNVDDYRKEKGITTPKSMADQRAMDMENWERDLADRLGKENITPEMRAQQEKILDEHYAGKDAALSGMVAPEQQAMLFGMQNIDAFRINLPTDYDKQKYALAELARDRPLESWKYGNQEPLKGQRDLLGLLEMSRGKDTVAKLQGQKALGESAYRGAQQQALGGGLAAATEATRQSQGAVSQVGEGAVSQDYSTRNMQNLLSTQGRAQDLAVTTAQHKLKLAGQQTNNAMVQFYLSLGDDFATAQKRAEIEFNKLVTAKYLSNIGARDATAGAAAGAAATVLGLFK